MPLYMMLSPPSKKAESREALSIVTGYTTLLQANNLPNFNIKNITPPATAIFTRAKQGSSCIKSYNPITSKNFS